MPLVAAAAVWLPLLGGPSQTIGFGISRFGSVDCNRMAQKNNKKDKI
jgi:hypothetical protein